ncbi:hypothetical protein FG386_002797 [Cryptosporidium ryanae]|uniref:uncharacterized protein n=1 Tax=Cryptosporidium ryanae TaxID=515981 RepID=UPI003519E231|nr:hypothetical protein FG386_002797 [Cryptosporidium ryanae]
MTDIRGTPLCSFRDDIWLVRYTLTPETVLEYFYLSPFCDPNSLNIKRRYEKEVDSNEGIEYRIIFINEEGLGNVHQPPGSSWNIPNQFGIFVIQKFLIEFQREIPLNVYYILSGTIYEAPSLGNLFLHRTAEAFLNMEKAFDSIKKMSRFNLYQGYTWDNLKLKHEKVSNENSDNCVSNNDDSAVKIVYIPKKYSKIDNILISAKKEMSDQMNELEQI